MSSEVQRDLKYVCCWNYYTMRLMGIWPEERRWWLLSSYLVLVPVLLMLGLVCIPQTINLWRIWNEFYLIIENLSMANVTITITAMKTVAFWVNGASLKSLLKWMAKDWGSQMKPTDREIMRETGRTTRRIIIRSTLMCNTVVITYAILRLITMKYDNSKFFFRAYFPYDTNISPNYELTYFGQLIAATCAAGCYTAVDTFVAMLILHVCGQLLILKKDIRCLHNYREQELQNELGKIVRKHDYLNKFVVTIEGCFNMMLLLQMIGCTMQLCFQCFQVIVSIDSGRAKEFIIFQACFLLIYVVYVIVQLYLYCHLGDKLAVESTDVAAAAYECEWYNLSPEDAKLLLIIIQRARLPFKITAGRFCSFTLVLYSQFMAGWGIQLPRLTRPLTQRAIGHLKRQRNEYALFSCIQILKTSMGYISVLYATKDK